MIPPYRSLLPSVGGRASSRNRVANSCSVAKLRSRAGALQVALWVALLTGATGCRAAQPFATEMRALSHQLIEQEAPAAFESASLENAVLSSRGVMLRPGPWQVAPHASSAAVTTAELDAPRPFREALIAWNASVPGAAKLLVEVRVRLAVDQRWSPWVYVGQWGTGPPWEGSVQLPTEFPAGFPAGRVDVDFLTCEADLDRVQVRCSSRSFESGVRLDRITLWLTGLRGTRNTGSTDSLVPSNNANRPQGLAREVMSSPIVVGARSNEWEIPVPVLSQRLLPGDLPQRACCPTSVAMLVGYQTGNTPDVVDVARATYDKLNDIYGNWPNAIQTAFQFGVPGYLRRFDDWDSVLNELAADQPLIISIRAEVGELTGAPYAETTGHLLVLRGYDRHGNLIVNDPAAATLAGVRRIYSREDLTRVWMDKGGLAFVLTKPEG